MDRAYLQNPFPFSSSRSGLFHFARYSRSAFMAVAISLGLILAMSRLIATDYREPVEDPPPPIASIHMEKPKPTVIEAEPPERPQTVPPQVVSPPVEVIPERSRMPTLITPPTPVTEGGPAEISRDPIPVYKPAPRYPAAALRRGVEGYVVVEFTITKSGSVRDPSVVGGYDSAGNPTEVFDRAALTAAAKFKYRPQMANGEPVERHGVRNRISFKIAD